VAAPHHRGLSEGDNPEDFLEHTKLELFQDQVFCFTPKGQLIALPRGATPIDFAYAVHTDIGDTCVGAKINGRIMPLVTRLANGDEVEILRSGVQVPPPAWEEIVVTGKARAAIRRATKAAVRKQYSGLGMRILERTFNRAGKPLSRESLKPVLHRLGHKEVEDALAAVGRGELGSDDVFQALFPNHQETRVSTRKPVDEGWFNLRSAAGLIFKLPGLSKSQRASKASRMADLSKETDAMPIRGMDDNSVVRFGPGGAVPGDRIVGILEPGAGITIYPIQSPGLTKFDDQPNRWIDIRWDIDENNKNRFPSRILVTAINAPGTLADVAQVIAASESNIQNLSMVRVAADFTEMLVDLQVWDLKHLNQLIAQLKELGSVSTVERIYQ
jgi:guanosine-3',5'-bis(diphosphate) 3'-pyrophosphohydrolase